MVRRGEPRCSGGAPPAAFAGRCPETLTLAPCLPAQILCCVCAIPIAPNAVNMCAQCLQTRYDIGEGISKQVQQNTCRGCGRYERRDGSFAPVEPESAELMALLLKKPRGLGSVRLVDASFIWTEPPSRRIKIKACVQKEVVSGAVMQQSFVIEYMLSNKQCAPRANPNQTP